MDLLIEVARSRRPRAMVGHVLGDNLPMLTLCSKLGFEIANSAEGPMVKRATLSL